MELTPRKPASPNFRGILSSRQGALAVAALCAIIAGGIVLIAINRYRHSVTASNAQSTVLVAKELIQKGTSGDAVAAQQLASPTSIIQKQISTGAIADAATLRGKVAARDILPGEQLSAADFVGSSGITAELAPNQRAMSVSLDQAHGMTGILQAGDHVDVYGGFNVDQGTAKPRPVMRLLIPNVQVLQAANAGGGIGGGGGGQNGNVVLRVNDSQASMIAFTQENGKVWLVLRPGTASSTPPTFQDLGSVLLGLTAIQTPTLNRQIAQIIARAQQ